ncbi:MAG: hypothetical protein AAFR29_01965 [Pseudomonadota bacterium]
MGDGADSIAKASGGWTLSWQGGTHTNGEFPNGETILSGRQSIVQDHGGEITFAPDGQNDRRVDVPVTVHDDDPYTDF